MTTTTTTGVFSAALLAPVPDETEAYDLPIVGALPPELTGRYLRNGPNPLPGENPAHWFGGHGMLHGIRLAGGRAEWYRNRWIRTDPFEGKVTDRRSHRATTANTHIIEHGGCLLALGEGGFPYQVDRELNTVGPHDFGGKLRTAMTAHPKQDPVTGELHFFGYGATPPYATYHRADASGQLVHSAEIEVAGPTMMHDFAVTENHVIWLDLPVTFDHTLIGRGMPYAWNEQYGARLGLMPKNGTEVRWFEVDPCYVFHVGNASELPDGRITLDVVRYGRAGWDHMWGSIGGQVRNGHEVVLSAGRVGGATLHRWTLDPATGVVADQPLDDLEVEFPTLNEERLGRANRFLYTVSQPLGAVVKFDTNSGRTSVAELGRDRIPGEAVFVPAADARNEDDGWLLTVVGDETGSASELVVLDASDLSSGRVATVQLPRRVPAGFHGSWIPDPVG